MSPDPTARPAPLFVGDHLALDFLNSLATPAGESIEWLRDGADLVNWLEQARAIEPSVAAKFRMRDKSRALDSIAEEARSLREWLRRFVRRHAGSELGTDAVAELAPLNRLLAQDDSYCQVEAAGEDAQHPLRHRRLRRWTKPEQLLQPLAEAIADLVSHADFRLIRACEGSACTLMFLDKTKAHARRWCSMALCGNRAKVAAHRARATDKRRRRGKAR
jgi:predicted RNA-binding Zn ribbon-like protein